MIIYKATNLINNKVYIGQTIQKFKKRIGQHKNYSKKSNLYFYNSLKKYGFENFEWKIIDESAKTIEQLNNQEIYYIYLYDSTNKEKGYNIDKGGRNCISYYKASDETKEKIGKKLKNRIFSQEHRDKIGIANSERIWKEESKDKIRNTHKGNKYCLGKHHSEESNLKNSINQPNRIEIECIETGDRFKSLTECSEKMKLNINCLSTYLSGYYKNKKSVGGFTFKKINI